MTKELSETLLGQKAYKELRDSIDRFASDDQSLRQYERFMEKHQHHRLPEPGDLKKGDCGCGYSH